MIRSGGAQGVGRIAIALLACACSSDSPCDVDCDESVAGMQASGGMGGGGGAEPMAGSGGMMPVAMPDAGPVMTFDSCLPTPTAAAPNLTELYSGPLALTHVGLTAQGVIAADPAQGIYRFDTEPAPEERIVATQLSELLVADLNAYWVQDAAGTGQSTISRAGLSATDATPAVVAQGLPHRVVHLRYDEENLYFGDAAGGGLFSLPIAGGRPEPLVAGVLIEGLRLQAGYLYYSDSSSRQVHRFALGTLTVEALTMPSGVTPSALTTDGTTVYWVGERQIFATAIGDPSSTVAIGQGGMGPGGSGHIESLVLQGDRLYWIDEHGNFGTTSTDGAFCMLYTTGVRSFDLDENDAYLASESTSGTELYRFDY